MSKKKHGGKKWFYAAGQRAAAHGFPFRLGKDFARGELPEGCWRAWQNGFMDHNRG